MTIAFISGHIDLSEYEFECYYEERILRAIADNHSFILGSAKGTDRMAAEFIATRSEKIIMYIFERNQQNQIEAIEACQKLDIDFKTGFTSYSSRDKLMTSESTYDIAWVRSVAESKLKYGEKFNPNKISGTQQNINRRKAYK